MKTAISQIPTDVQMTVKIGFGGGSHLTNPIECRLTLAYAMLKSLVCHRVSKRFTSSIMYDVVLIDSTIEHHNRLASHPFFYDGNSNGGNVDH